MKNIIRSIKTGEFRYTFLKWLSIKVFKTPKEELPNKYVNFVYAILCPLHYNYTKQSLIKFNPMRDIYTIHGVEYSRMVLKQLGYMYKDGYEILVCITEGGEKEVLIKGVKPKKRPKKKTKKK